MHHFCAIDLGSFYLDVIKDRQYTTQADSRARDAHRRLVIIPGERPRRVFELLGLIDRLDLAGSRAEAVRSK